MLRKGFGHAGAASAAAACGLFFVVAAPLGAAAQSGHSPRVPDFSGLWERAGPIPSTFLLPEDESKPGPVWDPQDHAVGGVLWLGDHTNPILKPHAAERIAQRNEFLTNGGEDLPPHSLCWPSGVPQVLNLREPVQFLQTDNEVTIIFQRDHQVRHVYLNSELPMGTAPNWYGQSVGHYEGDTLVVTTIGQNTKTDVDKFGTPHSGQMRVVERFSLNPDGAGLTVEVMVEDPETFTMPWFARATYRRDQGPFEEIVCAENNKNASTGLDYPIPIYNGPSAF